MTENKDKTNDQLQGTDRATSGQDGRGRAGNQPARVIRGIDWGNSGGGFQYILSFYERRYRERLNEAIFGRGVHAFSLNRADFDTFYNELRGNHFAIDGCPGQVAPPSTDQSRNGSRASGKRQQLGSYANWESDADRRGLFRPDCNGAPRGLRPSAVPVLDDNRRDELGTFAARVQGVASQGVSNVNDKDVTDMVVEGVQALAKDLLAVKAKAESAIADRDALARRLKIANQDLDRGYSRINTLYGSLRGAARIVPFNGQGRVEVSIVDDELVFITRTDRPAGFHPLDPEPQIKALKSDVAAWKATAEAQKADKEKAVIDVSAWKKTAEERLKEAEYVRARLTEAHQNLRVKDSMIEALRQTAAGTDALSRALTEEKKLTAGLREDFDRKHRALCDSERERDSLKASLTRQQEDNQRQYNIIQNLRDEVATLNQAKAGEPIAFAASIYPGYRW